MWLGRSTSLDPGLEMLEQYDAESGVTEVDTRVSIMNALRQGWVPAWEGLRRFRLSVSC